MVEGVSGVMKVEMGVLGVAVVEQTKAPRVLGRSGEEYHKKSLSTLTPP